MAYFANSLDLSFSEMPWSLSYNEYAVIRSLQLVARFSSVDILWFLKPAINVSENFAMCWISDSEIVQRLHFRLRVFHLYQQNRKTILLHCTQLTQFQIFYSFRYHCSSFRFGWLFCFTPTWSVDGVATVDEVCSCVLGTLLSIVKINNFFVDSTIFSLLLTSKLKLLFLSHVVVTWSCDKTIEFLRDVQNKVSNRLEKEKSFIRYDSKVLLTSCKDAKLKCVANFSN